jgi:hypothetical protein
MATMDFLWEDLLEGEPDVSSQDSSSLFPEGWTSEDIDFTTNNQDYMFILIVCLAFVMTYLIMTYLIKNNMWASQTDTVVPVGQAEQVDADDGFVRDLVSILNPETKMKVNALIEMGTNCLDSGLTRFYANEHFLNAGLLVLATGDYIRTVGIIQLFNDLDYTFVASEEGKFLITLTESVMKGDEQAFTNTVFQYNQIKKLDDVKTSLIMDIWMAAVGFH